VRNRTEARANTALPVAGLGGKHEGVRDGVCAKRTTVPLAASLFTLAKDARMGHPVIGVSCGAEAHIEFMGSLRGAEAPLFPKPSAAEAGWFG
jgi:hypothetical protein